MTTTGKRLPKVYAVAKATMAHGYGHVEIYVHELGGYRDGTLKISCQTGGSYSQDNPTSYAWEYGISTNHSVMGMDALKNGYRLMRKLSTAVGKVRDAEGAPRTFSEFAIRVLRAAGVRRVHLLPGVNPGYYGDPATLPSIDPRKQGDYLREELGSMEAKVLEVR